MSAGAHGHARARPCGHSAGPSGASSAMRPAAQTALAVAAQRTSSLGCYSATGSGGFLPARVSLSHRFQASVW